MHACMASCWIVNYAETVTMVVHITNPQQLGSTSEGECVCPTDIVASYVGAYMMLDGVCTRVGPFCGREWFGIVTWITKPFFHYYRIRFRPIPFIRYKKGGLSSISWLKTVDTNKCSAWPISMVLLVSAGLGRPTPLSHVQIQKNIIWIHYETCIFFKFRIHSNIYTGQSQEYSSDITRIHSSHSPHKKFNSQIVYSQ
jgi:hypothetical protein